MKKITLLVDIIILLGVLVAAYLLFSNKDDDKKDPKPQEPEIIETVDEDIKEDVIEFEDYTTPSESTEPSVTPEDPTTDPTTPADEPNVTVNKNTVDYTKDLDELTVREMKMVTRDNFKDLVAKYPDALEYYVTNCTDIICAINVSELTDYGNSDIPCTGNFIFSYISATRSFSIDYSELVCEN